MPPVPRVSASKSVPRNVASLLALAIFFLTAARAPALDAAPFDDDVVEIGAWSLMGPMPLPDDSPTSAGLPEVLGAVTGEEPRLDAVAWYGRDPYRWLPLESGADGYASVEDAFSDARRGEVVFLARRILCDDERPAALSISAEGRAAAWLNGALVLDSCDEPWTAPGADRWVKPVRVLPGVNLLVVKTWRSAGSPWRVRARVLSAMAFAGGAVHFPRWAFDTAPPWSLDKPPRVRWGDSAVLGFLGRSPVASALVLRHGDATARTDATRGEWAHLDDLLKAMKATEPGLYWVEMEGAEKSRAKHALPLGALDRAAASAAGLAKKKRADLPPDVGAVLDFLEDIRPRHVDPRGAAIHTAMRSVEFFPRLGPGARDDTLARGVATRAGAPRPTPAARPCPTCCFCPPARGSGRLRRRCSWPCRREAPTPPMCFCIDPIWPNRRAARGRS